VAVSALAIGVGANIVIFSLVNVSLLRPLDTREPLQLVRVTGPGGDQGTAGATEDPAHILPTDFVRS
jgi:hypothetical protein